MGFRLEHAESIPDGLRRVAIERLDDAVDRLDRLGEGDSGEVATSVHEVRKRCKEVRGLIRLVRPALGDEYRPANRRLREAAEQLSATRDAEVLLATIGALGDAEREAGRSGDLGSLERAQRAEAAAAAATLGAGAKGVDRARRRLVKVRRRVDGWELGPGFDSIAAGLEETYRRGRRGLRGATRAPSDRSFHEWRKPVKYLWYQLRLLEPTAPSMLGPLVDRLDDLADTLGSDHDLAVLVERLESGMAGGDPGQAQLAVDLARSGQEELRSTALGLGARVYAEKPKAFVARIGAYWEADRRFGPETPPP